MTRSYATKSAGLYLIVDQATHQHVASSQHGVPPYGMLREGERCRVGGVRVLVVSGPCVEGRDER